MQWMEMHQVGFGECVVLGGRKKEILMIDCGSLQGRLDDGTLFSDYTRQISERYGRAKQRTFLLTHFHKDHYGGLPLLLEQNPRYFGQIFLPNCPLNEKGVPLLLELAILIDCFVPKQTLTSRMNAGALRVFDKIGKLAGTEVIYTLKAGDSFVFDGVTYDVLWPPRDRYPFDSACVGVSQEINAILQTQSHQRIQAFLELKEELCAAYVRCMDAFAMQTDADQQERLDCIEDICLLIQDLDAMIPALHLLPVAQTIADLLCGQRCNMAYSDAVNGASLIFHNRSDGVLSYDDLLMTGDANPAAMNAIAPQLRENYYIVKAPHHGTRSGWWPGLETMGISHILISNGAKGKGGRVDARYPALNALRHCTSSAACEFCQKNSCCNRFLLCQEARPRPSVPAQCRRSGCGIQILPFGKKNACWCQD